MADTYTARTNLVKPANNDGGWDVLLNSNFTTLDAQNALGALAVRAFEDGASTTLKIKVAAGVFRKADGTAVSVAATASITLGASVTSYVYVTDAGTVTTNTTGFPAATNLVPLATVVTNGSTVVAITDSRAALMSFGGTPAVGTVTSVALSAPAIFAVAGSPITASGTLAVTLATQSANLVWAGPTTGAAAEPTFRALVAADIPTIAESGVTGLVADLAAKAPLASPTFTGTPAAPTASPGTNTTQIATTAFVLANATAGTVMIASGASHAAGYAPDPGASAGTTRFLREDATWARPLEAGSACTVTVGSGGGSGYSFTGSGAALFAGHANLTTGSSCAASATVLTVTYPATLPLVPVAILLSPGNAAAAALSGAGAVYVDYASLSTSAFLVKSGTTPLVDSTLYIWFWTAILQ